MKKTERPSEAELWQRLDEIKARELGGKTLGFYIQLLFVLAALCAIAVNGAWNVLWSIFAYLSASVLAFSKPFFWNWTEKRLQQDAAEGRTTRAVYWDYLSVVIDWSIAFFTFSLTAFCVFALARSYSMSCTAQWLCVAASYTMPMSYARREPGYHWGNYRFWEQWCVVAIVVASAFLPIGPAHGVALQLATAAFAVPLTCAWKRESIVKKVEVYRDNATAAKAMNCEPPPPVDQSIFGDLYKHAFAEFSIQWIPFSVTIFALLAGLAWVLVLHKPLAVLFAIIAGVLGYFVQMLICYPFGMGKEEMAKRNLDTDLASDILVYRVMFTMLSLLAASTVVVWLGGRDAVMLAALSILALGACNITAYANETNASPRGDWLYLVVYAVAFASACALRLDGMRWWACLLPIPTIAYIAPTIRWFFPRSGLRGDARKAAIAEMTGRLKADIRSDAEKSRDDKREKRRRRDERRLANLRRSRGGRG